MAQPVQVAGVETKADGMALNVRRVLPFPVDSPRRDSDLLPRLAFGDGLPELSV